MADGGRQTFIVGPIFCFWLIISSSGCFQASEARADQAKNLTTPLSFEEGWAELQEAFTRATELNGSIFRLFTSDEYIRFYKTVYEHCADNHHMSAQFYEGYKNFFKEYLTSKVLPSLREKKDEKLLQELVRTWSNFKTTTGWLSRFFYYLNRYYLPFTKQPSLRETSYLSFYKLVYGEVNDQVRDVLIDMIDQEQEGGQIDEALVKNVLDVYVEMAEGSMKFYVKDFEEALLKDTARFYHKKAVGLMTIDSDDESMRKVKEWVEREREGTSYLKVSQKKLLQVSEHELLTKQVIKEQHEEKLQSRALMADE
ncbi:hypothetical protein Nepgr_010163 [Nepenthes gracilis]|uniref:Cullin N-terminal domain-containing protein n=1 Tax=Nepenthes gracilis TaxID=150966 RepID=A0AAD3XKT0_NEPGR|nr:hypothetical protein Nepgr_010163 [Nepenthes gracilis]